MLRLFYRLSSRKLILHDPREIKRMHQKVKELPPPGTPTNTFKSVFTVSLIGLPNCGKSTLFNMIVGQRLALTDAIPGMTRDRKQITIWNGLLRLIDTAGVEQKGTQQNSSPKQQIECTMKEDMFKQTITAFNESDLTLLMIDAKKGVTEAEKTFVQYLRKYGSKHQVILVVNKCDNQESEVIAEVSELGFKEIHYVSAEHGNGVLELMQRINQCIPERLRDEVKQRKANRLKKFDKILKGMRDEFKKLAMTEDADLRSWQKDFMRLNPNPEDNSELDEEQPNTETFTKPQQVEVTGRGVSEKNAQFKKTIQLSIIGRPNVGKSSLINYLLGQNKMIVSQIPNTTRDSITTEWTYKDRRMRLVDTAGLSTINFDNNPQHLKKVQITTMNHVKFSHVVIYLLDAMSPIKSEDFTFIRRIIQEGRAVVLAVNKWETIKSEFKKKAARYIDKQIETHLGSMNKPAVVYFSVKTNEGVERLMEEVMKIYEHWNCRVSTGMLNDWLRRFKKLDNLPRDGDNQLKIRYIVQAKVRPPTFIAFVNNKDLFKQNYLRFMRKNLVEEFGLHGIAVRIILKNVKSTGQQATPKAASKTTLAKKRKQFIKSLRRREKILELKVKYGNFGVREE